MRYKSNMAEAYEKVLQSQVKELKEDGHIDVPSMKRLCKVITDNVNDIDMKLDEMSGDESIDTWWTNKMSASSTLIESCRNYIMNPEDDMEESVDLSEAVDMPKSDIDNVKSFTDKNQHYEARAYICARMKDGRLKSIYNEVGSLQDKYNKELGFLLSRGVRDQLDKMVLLPKLKRAFKNWNEIYSSI